MTPFRLGIPDSSLARLAALLEPFTDPRPVEIIVENFPTLSEWLLATRIDAGACDAADVPINPVEGLVLAATPPRGPVGDAFVSNCHRTFDDLPHGAFVGADGTRRRAMLLHRRSDLGLVRLPAPDADGVVLGESDLVRLGQAASIREVLDETWMLPSPGQGAVGFVCREIDAETRLLLEAVNDESTWRRVTAERAAQAILGDDIPLGVLSRIQDGMLFLRGMALSPDGRRAISASHRGPAETPLAIGQELAAMLIDEGARELSA